MPAGRRSAGCGQLGSWMEARCKGCHCVLGITSPLFPHKNPLILNLPPQSLFLWPDWVMRADTSLHPSCCIALWARFPFYAPKDLITIPSLLLCFVFFFRMWGGISFFSLMLPPQRTYSFWWKDVNFPLISCMRMEKKTNLSTGFFSPFKILIVVIMQV